MARIEKVSWKEAHFYQDKAKLEKLIECFWDFISDNNANKTEEWVKPPKKMQIS